MNILSTIKHIINGVDIDSLKSKIAELESQVVDPVDLEELKSIVEELKSILSE